MTNKALDKVINGTKAERRFLCEESFGLFAIYYFSQYFSYSIAPYHKEMIKDLHDLIEGNIREVAWIMFRESAKTTFAKLFIIWMIAYKKKMYINVDSFDKENAERILFDVAYELTNNKRLMADYGPLFTRKRVDNEVKQTRINNFITENGIRVEAHSTQESVRGRIHRNQRPDFLLCDDIETNKTKESQAYTKQVKDHLTEAMAGMSPEGCILYLGNYITEYGNIAYLMERAKTDEKIRVRNVPVMTDNVPAWPSKYALTDEEAKKTGKVSIEDKQKQLGSQVFSYEMMNQPIDDSIAEFKREFEQKATLDDIKHMEKLSFATIDSAVSEKTSADFTGITINHVTVENKWYIETYRLKINSKKLIDHIFYLWETYDLEMIGLEKTTFTMAIEPYIQEEMRKRNVFPVIKPLTHTTSSKETRIRGVIPRWESKSIFLIGDNQELRQEMRVFPRGQHDDVLDSLAMQSEIAYAPRKKQDLNKILGDDESLYSEIGL